MFSLWQLGAVALAYVLVLFVIAWWGDRAKRRGRFIVNNAWTFSLGLGVYCTSWTFYGAVGEASSFGWAYLPIYLGPIITILLGGELIYKMASVSRQHHITSIADFLAARYGKSRRLAVLVTLVAIIGILPYIALQLKALTLSFEQVVGPAAGVSPFNVTLIIALMLALFAILFGTRHISANEHQSGLMLAIAFESLVKVVVFVIISLFCIYVLFDGVGDLWHQALASVQVRQVFDTSPLTQGFVTSLLLSVVAMVCLPREFHAGIVENTRLRFLRPARRIFAVYLALFAIFALPIVAAGMLLQPNASQPDMYMLSLPGASGHEWMMLLAFVGGVAASTGMVIVSTMALAIMFSNEVMMPLWVQSRIIGHEELSDLSGRLQLFRRLSILLVVALAVAFDLLIGHFQGLARIGLLSFAAVAQFAPALLGGLYWRQGHRRGAFIGITLGFIVWGYCLLLPAVLPLEWLAHLDKYGLFGLGILRPQSLLGIGGMSSLAHGVFWSLGLNTLAYIYFSKRTWQSSLDETQATHFVDMPTDWWREGLEHPLITSAELLQICERGLGHPRASQLFYDYLKRRRVSADLDLPAPLHLVRYVERLLSGAMGASTARIVMGSLLSKPGPGRTDMVRIMDEASQLIQFNHQLLRTTIETINHGICVVDRELKIVAWNQTYINQFNYPEGLIRLGRPIEDIYHFNAKRGFYIDDDLEDAVRKRVQLLRNGGSHSFERRLPNGIVVEVRGNPMEGGGFVSTYMDISERKRDEMALRQINENLESMVTERTRRLSELNTQLEQANEGKTRFLATAGHDLMQPLNAAQLFASSLSQRLAKRAGDFNDERGVLGHIDSSLRAAEHIILALLDISRLDTGTMQAHPSAVAVRPLMEQLGEEFDVLAHAEGLGLRRVYSDCRVQTDEALLRRVLQNLLSNAVRYTDKGRILFGCRRRGNELRIEVWDTGPGIQEDQLAHIFQEFTRLPHPGRQQVKGLGLGLAIADRICRLLGHKLRVKSWPARGTLFYVCVPIAADEPQALPAKAPEPPPVQRDVAGMRIFCVDNDATLLASLAALLRAYGCEPVTALSSAEALQLADANNPPDLLLVDYQLDHEFGFQVIEALDSCWEEVVPAVLITADRGAVIREEAHERGVGFLQKPVSEETLLALLQEV